jgi:hypothetical protein
VLFFGEGLAADQVTKVLGPDPTVATMAQGDELGGDLTLTRGGVRLTQRVTLADAAYRAILPTLQEAQGAAARANVIVYPVDPRRAPGKLFAQVVADTSSYYLLGYVPTNTKHDGAFRKLDVRSVRPGLRVQARTGYTAKNDTPKKPAAPTDMPLALTELMAAPIQVSGLTLSVTAPSFAGNGSKASVEVVIDVAGGALTAASGRQVAKGRSRCSLPWQTPTGTSKPANGDRWT